jgi:hypothetical protein
VLFVGGQVLVFMHLSIAQSLGCSTCLLRVTPPPWSADPLLLLGLLSGARLWGRESRCDFLLGPCPRGAVAQFCLDFLRLLLRLEFLLLCLGLRFEFLFLYSELLLLCFSGLLLFLLLCCPFALALMSSFRSLSLCLTFTILIGRCVCSFWIVNP